MKILRVCVVMCALALPLGLSVAQDEKPAAKPTAPNIDSITLKDIKADVHFLASDEMVGRETLSPEARITAGYVKSRMEAAGVKPGGENGGWYQEVNFRYRAWSEKKPALSFKVGETSTELVYEKDFVATFGAGPTINVKDAPVVFAGYAIKDEQQKYDDLANLDMKGKFAVVMRYAPSGWSREGRRNPFTRGGSINQKMRHCAAAGAIGVLLVVAPGSEDVGATDADRDLPKPSSPERSPRLELATGNERENTSLPFFNVTAAAVDKLLGGEGRLKALQQEFDKSEFGNRLALKDAGVSLVMETKTFTQSCRNVIGKIEGEIDEWIVFGAHHDAYGLGFPGAQPEPDTKKLGFGGIYNGADDNATGVTTVLEIAEAVAQSGKKPRRGFLFMTFTGEEKGLFGSRWYVANPVVPHEKVVAMINIDMIGRIRDKKLSILGASSSKTLTQICRDCAPLFPELVVDVATRGGGGGSDHAPFISTAGVPAVFAHSGLTPEYHTTKDDIETINFEDMVPTVRMLYEIAWRVSEMKGYPDYVGPVRDSKGPDGKPRSGQAAKEPEKAPEKTPEKEAPKKEEEFGR